MKLIQKISGATLAAATYATLAFPAFAETPINTCPQGSSGGFGKLCSSFNGTDAGRVIGTAITAIFVIAVIIALFFLLWGGIKWIMSGGDKAKVEAARGTIIASIVGLVIVFLSYFIVNLILQLFGLGSIQNLTLPTF